jgi:hypothetical protein
LTASPDRGTTLQLFGGIAQLGEHLICIQKVAGSIPVASTKSRLFFRQILDDFFTKKNLLKKIKKDVDGKLEFV